ncbi:MAG: hypothetical protein ACRDN9_07570 [Streptosporangiaceae bacterium]
MSEDFDPTANTQKFRAFVQGAEPDEHSSRSFAGPLLIVASLVALAIVAVIIWLAL